MIAPFLTSSLNSLGFIKMPQLIDCMEYNYMQWKVFQDRGIHTLTDIQKEKMSLLLDQTNHTTTTATSWDAHKTRQKQQQQQQQIYLSTRLYMLMNE